MKLECTFMQCYSFDFVYFLRGTKHVMDATPTFGYTVLPCNINAQIYNLTKSNTKYFVV